MLISKLTLTSEGTPICRHFKKSPQKKCRARKKIQSKRTLTDIRSAISKNPYRLSTSRYSFFPERSRLPLALTGIRNEIRIVLVQTMQMFSGYIPRLSESGHSALTRVLIGSVLERYNGVRDSVRIRIDRVQDITKNGCGIVAWSTESGHSGLTGELIRATLQRYNGVRGSQLSHRPTFPSRRRYGSRLRFRSRITSAGQFESCKLLLGLLLLLLLLRRLLIRSLTLLHRMHLWTLLMRMRWRLLSATSRETPTWETPAAGRLRRRLIILRTRHDVDPNTIIIDPKNHPEIRGELLALRA